MNCATFSTVRCRQGCLGSLCLAVFIYCQAWCWSAILFEPDPLPASTKPDARGRNLDEARERKTSTFGYDWTLQSLLFSISGYLLTQTGSTRKTTAAKSPRFSGVSVTCVFLDVCGAACRVRRELGAAGLGTLSTAQWWGQKESEPFKRSKEMRGLGLILHVQPPASIREYLWHCWPVYIRSVDIHRTKEDYFDWLGRVMCVWYVLV